MGQPPRRPKCRTFVEAIIGRPSGLLVGDGVPRHPAKATTPTLRATSPQGEAKKRLP